MQPIPYDASRSALYHPGAAENLFHFAPYRGDAAVAAELARLAYVRERGRLEDFLHRGGFALVEAFEAPGASGFVAAGSGLTALAFRGTEAGHLDDLRADLDARPTAWPEGGRVHRGFAAALRGAWDRVEPLLTGPGRRLYTGHSLGGALAALAASRSPPDALITFGAPRVGNADFARTLDAVAIQRFEQCCDLVPRLPPALLGYCSLGPLHYVDRRGRVTVDPPPRRIDRDRRVAALRYLRPKAGRRPGLVPVRELADHAPLNYLSAVLERRAPG